MLGHVNFLFLLRANQTFETSVINLFQSNFYEIKCITACLLLTTLKQSNA